MATAEQWDRARKAQQALEDIRTAEKAAQAEMYAAVLDLDDSGVKPAELRTKLGITATHLKWIRRGRRAQAPE